MTDSDVLVREFIDAIDPNEGERSLAHLMVVHAEPQIRRMLGQRMAATGVVERQDMEDLCAEVLSELLAKLRQVKTSAGADAIESFSSYTATITYRAYSDYLRRKYPKRHRLKTQLRYLLQVDPRFELRENQNHVWLCSLSQWSESQRQLRKIPTLEELGGLADEFAVGKPVAQPAEFVANLLKRLSAPVELNDLVGIVAEFWGVRDRSGVELDELDAASLHGKPKGRDVIELREWLSRLWTEIRTLPLAQRRALLLNLRDERGGPALALVPIAGIASLRDIAAVLEMAESELVSLWNQLPIDDLTIAERLGLTRQQVINLRKSARARLTRRLAGL